VRIPNDEFLLLGLAILPRKENRREAPNGLFSS